MLQLFIVLVNTFTVDRFGRKTLLIAGFSIQALALLVMSSLTTAFPNNDNKPAAVVEVICLFIVGMTYCWSNGPVPPAIASEIFPQEVRDKAFGISLLGQTSFLLAITQPWPKFNNEVGGRSYWLLFGLNTLCLVGHTLQATLKNNSNAIRSRSSSFFLKRRASHSSAWTRSSVRSML